MIKNNKLPLTNRQNIYIFTLNMTLNFQNSLSKLALATTLVFFFAFNAFAADIPGNCTEEIISIAKGNDFDIQTFIKDLAIAVVKAKLQAKVPFGKPKDGDKTERTFIFA